MTEAAFEFYDESKQRASLRNRALASKAPVEPGSVFAKKWEAGCTGELFLLPRDFEHDDPKSTIHLLRTDNPKRGASRGRFAQYIDGMTIADYASVVGWQFALADLAWDHNHQFIRVATPAARGAWSIRMAQKNLPLLLDLARSGKPQTIGFEHSCVLTSPLIQEQRGLNLGQFLLPTSPGIDDFELPPRSPDRDVPFAGPDSE